jgi:DNA-binding NarL/FixJ family response regulator
MAVRLLIVDDAEDSRFLMRVILADVTAVELVGEADGATAALEMIGELAPDVVTIDAVMPKVDGYQLAPMLSARLPSARLILLTAHVDEVVRRRAAAAGIHRVLGKEHFDRIPEVVVELAAAADP